MNKYFLVFSIFIFTVVCQAQQFSFQLTIIDAIGNTDSVTLGYDTSATAKIDSAFAEADIISLPYDSVFEIRASNIWKTPDFYGPWWETDTAFQTKIQIIHNNCDSLINWYSIIEVDVKTNNFPITVSWDSSLFNTFCRNGSLFTSNHPGGWWDVADGERAIFGEGNSVSFERSNYFSLKGNDTAWAYWVPIGDNSILWSALNDNLEIENSFKVFPNPTIENISFQIPSQFGKVLSVKIYTSIGQLLVTLPFESQIDLSDLESGIYFLCVTNSKGEKYSCPLIIE